MRYFNEPLWLIPLVYAIMMILVKNNIVRNTPGVIALNGFMFMRYVFTPFAYYSDGRINEMIAVGDLSDALIMMLYEMIVIFITLAISGNKYFRKFYNHDCNNSSWKYITEMKISRNTLFVLLSIAILFYIGFVYKSLGQGLSVFLNNSYNDFEDIESQIAEGEGYINILWQSLCAWLYMFLIMREKSKHIDDNNNIHIVYSLIFTLLYALISFIGSTGLTRWYTLVCASAGFSCLMYLFPTRKKLISISIVTPIFALMIFSSLVKNGGYESGTNASSSAESAFGATNMDVYFNGIGNLSLVTPQGLTIVGDGIDMLPADVLRTMPIINKYVNQQKTSIRIFQLKTGRTDQIIPLIGQSYLYFGFLLSPLLSLLLILVIRFLDFKFYYDYSYLKYVYAFSAIWIAAAPMCHNLTLVFMWVYIRIVPFYIIMKITNNKSELKLNIR